LKIGGGRGTRRLRGARYLMDDDDDLEDENDTKVERKQYPSLKGAFGIGNLDGARVDLN